MFLLFYMPQVLRLLRLWTLGIYIFGLLLLSLRTLCTILRTALCTVCDTCGIQSTTNDVITYTGEVLNTTTTYQYDRVFLQVVALSWDVRVHFLLVCQTHTGNFSHCRIRLLRCCSIDTNAYTTTLGTIVQRGRLALIYQHVSAFSYQLLNCRHSFTFLIYIFIFVIINRLRRYL